VDWYRYGRRAAFKKHAAPSSVRKVSISSIIFVQAGSLESKTWFSLSSTTSAAFGTALQAIDPD
jgi:hypothetical protein